MLAVATIQTKKICGDIVVSDKNGGVKVSATFTRLPKGKHGFHIHTAGDLRGDGCKELCEHYDVGRHNHGGPPNNKTKTKKRERHTGDLGNIEMSHGKRKYTRTYHIKNTSVRKLWGRSIIVHEGEDDLGRGGFEDSSITGHSGKRIGCAIFGRGCKK